MSATKRSKRVRVLVVEDSTVVRELLVHILTRDPEIQVAATAANGMEAIEAIKRAKPDVVTMDVHMPHLDGLEATREIMETTPVPIVIVSGSSSRYEVAATFRALEAGAVAIVEKPLGLSRPEDQAAAAKLVQTVKLMAEVKVIRRWPKRGAGGAPRPVQPVPVQGPRKEIKIVAIGASAGGPLVLQTILGGLPKGLSVPVVIVQHIATGFVEGFVEWLRTSSGFPVRLATDGERLLPGHAYVAPDGVHMKVDGQGRLALTREGLENGHRPSVSYLFRSVAEAYGPGAVGILLSGMGRDGADELYLMRERGALTMVQDPESAVVPGMPSEAIKLHAAAYILAPEQLVKALGDLIAGRAGAAHED